MEFDLSNLFVSHDKYKSKLEDLKNMLEFIKIEKIDLSNLEFYLDLINNLKEDSTKILVYASLRYYKDINNEITIKDKEVATSLFEETTDVINKINEKIIEINNICEVDGVYKYYLSKIIKEFKVKKVSIKENNILINKLLDEYNSLLSSINYGTIMIDSKKIQLTASNYSKYTYSKNKETRNAAYNSVHKSFLKKEENFIKIMRKLSSLKNDNAIKKGYSNILESALADDDLDENIIDNLIESVNSNLDIIHNYLKYKFKYMDISNPSVIDCGLSIVNKNYKYPLDEAKEIILNALKPLGERYLKVVKDLFDGHIDTVVDDKKHQTITFSWMNYSFLSYKDNYIDIKNLIHEIGHIVNYTFSKQKQIFLYEDSSIFCGEVASLVNELLLNKYLSEISVNEEDKLYYLTKNIENYFVWIYKKTMETEFENLIHVGSDINDTYENLIKKYYGNLDYSNFSNIEWTRLGILFRRTYYSFKYATGLLIASKVVNSIFTDKFYVDKYIDFLESGDSDTPINLLSKLNIDINNLNEGFLLIKQDVDKFIKIVNENN